MAGHLASGAGKLPVHGVRVQLYARELMGENGLPTTHFSPYFSQMSSSELHKFEFLLLNGFSNMVLASVLEPLRDVKMRGVGVQIELKIATMDGAEVRSSSGLTIRPDGAFDPRETNRTLVIVSGYQTRQNISKELLISLRAAARSSKAIIAVDTGAWLLAEAGLLDGHAATLHWQELDAFSEAFPNVQVSTSRFVQSGRYISCGGASTTLDMTLDLIRTHFGPAAAFEASNMFIYDPARQSELGRGAERLKDKASPKLLAALDVMAEHMEEPLTTFELAERVSVSERSLNRYFQSELGMTPGKYYRLFRLQKARHLAEETALSQEQIALRCGFSSGVSLARSFKDVFGLSIKDLRAM